MRSAASVRSNRSSSSAARRAGAAAGHVGELPTSTRFWRAGEQLVEGGVLAGHADEAAHRARPR